MKHKALCLDMTQWWGEGGREGGGLMDKSTLLLHMHGNAAKSVLSPALGNNRARPEVARSKVKERLFL